MLNLSLGWIGSLAFALCAFPQAYQCWQQGHARGLSPWFLGLWFLGEITTLSYVLLDMGFKWPLLFNYGLNLVFLLIILRYYWLPVGVDQA